MLYRSETGEGGKVRKSIGEFVLVCLVLQMVVLVHVNQRTPDVKTDQSANRYVQRSMAQSAAASWDEDYSLIEARFLEAELRLNPAAPGELGMQNVSLPVAEPAMHRVAPNDAHR